MSKKENNEVTVTQNDEMALALSVANDISLSSIMEDSGAGNENVTAEDTKTPFLRIIQALSPQHQKNEPEYIEGAEQGMLFNTISNELYSNVKIIPVHFEIRYIEKKRKAEGRTKEEFVSDHGSDKSVINNLEKEGFAFVTEGNNLIYPTATEYVLVVSENNQGKPALMSFPSTLADQSRRLNTIVSGYQYEPVNGKILNVRPPRWYKTLNVSTQIKTNGDNKWFVFRITEDEPLIKITDDGKVEENISNGLGLYSSAKSFRDLIYKGEVEISTMEDDVSPDASAEKAF